jgi:RNA polymerase sigma-70 factor, ECF subfamily
MNDAGHFEKPRAFEAEPSGTHDGTDFPSLSVAQERRLAFMLNSHFDSVWRAGRRMGLADAQAEENAQETFAIAARKLDRVEHGRERAYLLGVAVRLAVNARRRVAERLQQVAFDHADHETADSMPIAEELLEQKQQRAILDRILETMSDAFRQVLTLYEVEELTLPEIAMALEIPEGTAASRLRRAREEFSRKVQRFSVARPEEWP